MSAPLPPPYVRPEQMLPYSYQPLPGEEPLPPAQYGRGRSGPPNALNEIEPNPRGVTRAGVERAIAEWCADRANEPPLCGKLRKD